MTEPAETAREAVERNAKAIMEGNLAQLMADITPEALAEMMKMTAGQSAVSLQQLPAITGYAIEDLGEDGDVHRFDVRFESALGNVTLATGWKVLLGRWKVASASLVSAELKAAPETAPPAAGEAE